MIGRDLRFAIRILQRGPLFATVAGAAVAIAIALATAVFSLYSHLALVPVPGVAASDRLVSIGLAAADDAWIPMSVAQYRLLEDMLSTTDGVFSTAAVRREVEVDGYVADAVVTGVGPGHFHALGVVMLLGVPLDEAGGDSEAANAVVSERFWRERLGARAGVIGSSFTVEGREFTVVGVAGGDFTGLRRDLDEQVWVPIAQALDMIAPRRLGVSEANRRAAALTLPFVRVGARLRTSATLADLQRELDAVWPRVRDADAAAASTRLLRLEAVPGTAHDPLAHRMLVRQTQILSGGAALVLLVASLNLASYFLSRAPARARELRTRAAIGASRAALVRQLFVEAAGLIVVATAAGLLLHETIRAALLRLPPFVDTPPSLLQVATDWRVFAFAALASLVVAALAGLTPALRIGLEPARAGAARGVTALLVVQVALATLVVLVGTLFVEESRRLDRVALGFDPAALQAGRFEFESNRPRGMHAMNASQPAQFADTLRSRTSTLPGVDRIAVATFIPFLLPPANAVVVELPGALSQPPERERRAYLNRATPEIFPTLGMRFLHGRPYDGSDGLDVVVSRALARALWGREDVVGERLSADTSASLSTSGSATMVTVRQTTEGVPPPPEVLTVVGVVDDVRYASQGETATPMLYRPWAGPLFGHGYVVRGTVDARVVQPVIDELVRASFAPLVAGSPQSVGALRRASLGAERARGQLGTGAAALALSLIVIGLFAAMQHAVEARRSELAVRKAIGATDETIVGLILRRAGAIVSLGVLGAMAIAGLFHRSLTELLLGLDLANPRPWCIALAIVVATGLLASWWPARAAGRVDPAIALRCE